MSSTNKTQYYELSQYIGTDIPNPLTDYNGDMDKIDTALHQIAEAASEAGSDITALTTRVGSAESDIDALEAQNGNNVLTTDAQTLSGAINEVDAHCDDNASDIGAVSGRVTTVEGSVSALQTTVGNATTGLVKDVADLQTTVGDANSGLVKGVADLQTVVGDSDSGLVKEVADINKIKYGNHAFTNSDTTSNIGTVLKNVLTDIKAFLESLDAEYVKVTSIYITTNSGYEGYYGAEQPNFRPNIPNDYAFSQIKSSGNSMTTGFAYLSTSFGRLTTVVVDGNGSTFTDRSSETNDISTITVFYETLN